MPVLSLDPVPILDTTDSGLLLFKDNVQLNYNKIQAIVNRLDSSNFGGLPINVSGSPVGPFNNCIDAGLAVGNNQQLIAAPGVGNSIYLQSLEANTFGAAIANVAAVFHAAGGAVMGVIILGPANGGTLANDSKQILFPGGFELPTNTALQVNILGASISVGATWAVGPTI